MSTQEKIIDTITKLRNLATNNSNPDEAANAAAKMQDLLFRHNLSEDDLKTDLEKTPVYEKEIIDIGVASPQSKAWKVALMNLLALNNFCKVFNTRTSEVWLIGQEENRMVVKYLYDFLSKDLIRMGKLAAKEAKQLGPINSTFWKKSFFVGAVETINMRLREQRRHNIAVADADNGKGTALALKIDNALRLAVDALVPHSRVARTRGQRLDGNGYSAGVQAGNNAKLNRELPNRRL